MLGNVLSQVTGILDRRFLLNAFFPSLIFWGLLLVIFVIGQGNPIESVTGWNQQDPTLKILEIIGFISWVTFFAGILASQLTTILRIYEGYNPPISWLKRIGVGWYRPKLEEYGKVLKEFEKKTKQNPGQNLNDPYYEKIYQEIYRNYPPRTRPEQVMPTRLGNILKGAELYPNLRYGIDAVLIWPRLYNLFPEQFILIISEAKSALDFMLVLSLLSSIFALFSGGYLLVVGASWWLFLICFWGGLLSSWMAYQGALGNANLYAEQIKAAFDLYRNELLKQMRLKPPDSSTDERKQWKKLDSFVYRNLLTDGAWNYTDPPEAEAKGNKQP